MTSSTQTASYGSLICCTYDSTSKIISQNFLTNTNAMVRQILGLVLHQLSQLMTQVPNVLESLIMLPQMNVVVVNRSTGDLISDTPVLLKMRSANEASLIGIKDQIFVENNFGHTLVLSLSWFLMSLE